jgi:hypothetical protein
MTFPAMMLALVMASLYGALYHLGRGGAPWRLLLYLGLAWAGFAAGHLLGGWLPWSLPQIGPLNAVAGTIGSLLFLGLGDWLSRIERG